MGRIYQGQSSLTLKVHTGCALNSAEETLIKYRKPDGSEGAFGAALLDESAGILSYDVGSEDLDQAGWWRFWAWVMFPGGRCAPGRTVRIFVHREGR